MDLTLEIAGGELRAAFTGAADSLRAETGSLDAALGRLDERATVSRPGRIRLDFTGLDFVDSGSFARIAAVVERLFRAAPVALIGPGPGLERLFSLIRPPGGWRWSAGDEAEARGPAAGAAAAGPGEGAGDSGRPAVESGPGGEDDLFVIDVDRERLLLESEPPAPEYDPMAEPLVLLDRPPESPPPSREAEEAAGGGSAATGRPAAPPGREERSGGADGLDQLAAAIDSINAIIGDESEGPGGDRPDADLDREEALDLADEVDDAFGGSRGDRDGEEASDDFVEEREAGSRDLDRLDAPDAPPAAPPGGLRPGRTLPAAAARAAVPDPPGAREAILKEKLIAAIIDEDRLRARIAELEAETVWLRRSLEAGPPAPPASAPAPTRGAGDMRPAEGGRGPRDRDRPASPGGGSSIPAFLRSDPSRSRIVRAFAAVLRARRIGRQVPGRSLVRIAAAITAGIRRAPFGGFDLAAARAGEPPAAAAVSTTAMALCMAARAGATAGRLRALALEGLLSVVLARPDRDLPEPPAGPAARRAFARRIHSKLLALTGDDGAPIREAEVVEDLLVLSLVREFWTRIGPGPEGGAEPAAAALEVAGGAHPDRLRRLFLRTFSAFPPGTWVRLESGEVGVAVAPGSRSARAPLVLSLYCGGEEELRARSPRLVDTGVEAGSRVVAAVRCPVGRCPAPRPVVRLETTV